MKDKIFAMIVIVMLLVPAVMASHKYSKDQTFTNKDGTINYKLLKSTTITNPDGSKEAAWIVEIRRPGKPPITSPVSLSDLNGLTATKKITSTGVTPPAAPPPAPPGASPYVPSTYVPGQTWTSADGKTLTATKSDGTWKITVTDPKTGTTTTTDNVPQAGLDLVIKNGHFNAPPEAKPPAPAPTTWKTGTTLDITKPIQGLTKLSEGTESVVYVDANGNKIQVNKATGQITNILDKNNNPLGSVTPPPAPKNPNFDLIQGDVKVSDPKNLKRTGTSKDGFLIHSDGDFYYIETKKGKYRCNTDDLEKCAAEIKASEEAKAKAESAPKTDEDAFKKSNDNYKDVLLQQEIDKRLAELKSLKDILSPSAGAFAIEGLIEKYGKKDITLSFLEPFNEDLQAIGYYLTGYGLAVTICKDKQSKYFVQEIGPLGTLTGAYPSLGPIIYANGRRTECDLPTGCDSEKRFRNLTGQYNYLYKISWSVFNSAKKDDHGKKAGVKEDGSIVFSIRLYDGNNVERGTLGQYKIGPGQTSSGTLVAYKPRKYEKVCIKFDEGFAYNNVNTEWPVNCPNSVSAGKAGYINVQSKNVPPGDCPECGGPGAGEALQGENW